MEPIRRKRHLVYPANAALGRYPGFSFTSCLFYEQSVIVEFSSPCFPAIRSSNASLVTLMPWRALFWFTKDTSGFSAAKTISPLFAGNERT